MRYIGSKARISKEIIALAGQPDGNGRFVDAFCGMGSVGNAAADFGWSVHLNDQLLSAVTISGARLISKGDVDFRQLGNYEKAIELLRAAPQVEGFVWREYSPASGSKSLAQVERRYFTEGNALRIDGIRQLIASWSREKIISKREEILLISDLLLAVNRVANISGTYGSFLREWHKPALNEISIDTRSLRDDSVMLTTSCVDVTKLEMFGEDLAYFDPPYTKRQYAAYYHILETVCSGDEPQVAGKTGLRPWEHLASPFCYKSKALNALISLITNCPARRMLLSYSNEGHVDLQELRASLGISYKVQIHDLGEIGRYRPNRQASVNSGSVSEYLIEIIKNKELTSR